MHKIRCKNLISLVMCFVILAVTVCTSLMNVTVSAVAYPCMGVIEHRYGYADIYSHAGTTGHEVDEFKNQSVKLTRLYNGESIMVFGYELDGDGDTWYKIGYGTGYQNTGYAYETRLKLIGDYVYDEEFEKHLTEQGFPESYKEGLRNLHTLYPNWVFNADHTNLDYSTVIKEETPRKFVAASSGHAWKSMENGHYFWPSDTTEAWTAGSYKFAEGESWVMAHSSVVNYFMDPRNFFDTTSIFIFLKQSHIPGSVTPESVQEAAKGSFLEGMLPDDPERSYAQAIVAAADEAKLNPFVIMGLIKQEQGPDGSGKLISGVEEGYQGYYNFFSVGAYAGNGMDVIQRGLWYAKGGANNSTVYGRPWDTREKSIRGGAQFYSESYIAVGQDTLYYKNFNVYENTKHAIYTHQYATNIEDSVGKASGFAGAYREINDVPVIFHIPVYLNMPESTELPPTGSNNNNYLKNLYIKDIDGINFEIYKNSYELVVPYTVKEIDIVAEKWADDAKVEGAGKRELIVGTNNIDIKVTASSGVVNTYNIKVSRKEGFDVVPEPTLKTDYKQGTYLTGITPDTSVSDIIKNLGVQDGTAKILDKNGTEKLSGNIATGDKVYIYDLNEQHKQTLTVVVYGDINGDSRITSYDLFVGQRHILEIAILEGPYREAVDINHDKNASSIDLYLGQRHILELQFIKQ